MDDGALRQRSVVRRQNRRRLRVPFSKAGLCGVYRGLLQCADQDERFALIRRQFGERHAKLLELDPAVLLGMRLEAFGIAAVGILDLAAPLAVLRPEQIPQDGEKPR